MNRFACLSFPALLSGCIVTAEPNHNPQVGSIQFNWAFSAPGGGATCADADVQQISVTINGSTLTVPCNDWETGDGQSVTIDDLPLGALPYTLSGLSFTYDDNGNITGHVASYQGGATATVIEGGLDIESITLTPLSATQNDSNIILLWSFNGQTCDQAGVTSVNLAIIDPVGGNVNASPPCSAAGVDGASVGASPSVPGSTGFAAGSYPFTLAATGASASYYAAGTLYANGYSDTSAHVDLGVDTGAPPSSGPGTLTLDFSFGSSADGCAVAGVDHLISYLTDDTGAVVAGTYADIACVDPLSPVTFTSLASPNTYFVNAEGQGGGSTLYELLQYAVSVYPSGTSTYDVPIPSTSNL